jgi:hypothetical protein
MCALMRLTDAYILIEGIPHCYCWKRQHSLVLSMLMSHLHIFLQLAAAESLQLNYFFRLVFVKSPQLFMTNKKKHELLVV